MVDILVEPNFVVRRIYYLKNSNLIIPFDNKISIDKVSMPYFISFFLKITNKVC